MRVAARIAFAVSAVHESASMAHAQGGDLTALADKVFAPWNSTHSPGCAVGVAQGSRMVLARAYGMADLTNSIAITPNTILESGSVAKQFTSTAVLLLMQDGKLALDDDARKYLPELPVYSRPITIRHLLTHTSGLREWSNLVSWQGWPRGTRVHTQSDVFELVTHQKALNYPVGDFYSYTNSGFLMLRTLVERVSGKPFAQFTDERIFKPLGLTHTRWRDDFTNVVPGLAQAYARQRDGWHIEMPNDNVIAAGGLLTTVGDWLTWNDALTTKKLGAAWSDSITRRMKLTGGTEIQYALGLVVSNYRGLREIGHSGSTAGYSTYLARYPDKDNLSIAVMCNASGAPATSYAHAIVDGMFADLSRPVALDSASRRAPELAAYAGIYRNTRTNTTVELENESGQLRRVGGGVLRLLTDGTVASGGTRLRFARSNDGRVGAFRQATPDGDSLEFVRVGDARWTPTAAQLAAIAGRYRNDEIGVTFDVRTANGTIIISPRAGVADTATALYREEARDAFSRGSDAVWFDRDAKGRATAMHFGSARVWDFISTRIP